MKVFQELESVKGINKVNNKLDRDEPYVFVEVDIHRYGQISAIVHQGSDPISGKCMAHDLMIGQVRPLTNTTGKIGIWLVPREPREK